MTRDEARRFMAEVDAHLDAWGKRVAAATAGYRQCSECSWFDGSHAPHCRTRGYQHPWRVCRDCGGFEGRHSWLCPAKPPASAPATAKCECGVDAARVGGLHSSWCPRRT